MKASADVAGRPLAGGPRTTVTGRASTMFNAMRQVGGAIGVALLTTAIVLIGATHLAAGLEAVNLTAYRIAVLVATAFALAGVASALSIHDTDAAASTRTGPHRRSPGSGITRRVKPQTAETIRRPRQEPTQHDRSP